jgi:uncharacterized membrane protein YoaK (UPF0700 family)
MEHGSVEEKPPGPLPVLLLGLTAVTGLVDAFSFLALGHVFVANVTGNVIFLGFALAGAGDVELTPILAAMVPFAFGALAGGRVIARRPTHHHHLIAAAALIQAVILTAGAVIATVSGLQQARHVILVALSFAMGIQTAVAHRVAFPDMPTTFVTMTFTGLIADSTVRSIRARRALAVGALLVGAIVGGLLARFAHHATPLWVAVAVLASIAVTSFVAVRKTAPAHR